MYTPSLNIQSNGVPKLSGKEIDIIGERYAVDFQPDILRNPGPIDIESFLELYLGLNLDFQYLSHRCVYLGMVVFNDADIPVYCPERGRAEAIHEDEQTVVVDKNLLNQNQDARLRFTYGHECGH